MCQCVNDEWKNIHKGTLVSVGSPYEDKYVDVKFVGDLSGSVTVTVEEGQSDNVHLCMGLMFLFFSFLFFFWKLSDLSFSLMCFSSSIFVYGAGLQGWRLLFLAIGLVLLLLAPVVSSSVPFYYSSSMVIGICLVIIILLFQVNRVDNCFGIKLIYMSSILAVLNM